jgi:hypothetical protein
MTQLELFPTPPRAEQLTLSLTYTPERPTAMIHPLRVAIVTTIGAFLTLPTVAALTLIFTR